METSAHSDMSANSTERPAANAMPTSATSPSPISVGRLLRSKRHNLEHTITRAQHRLSTGSVQAQQYAGQLSTRVFGKIRSLWSASEAGSEAGLNQLATGTDHATFVLHSFVLFFWVSFDLAARGFVV